MKIHVLAIGKMRDPWASMIRDYEKRLTCPFTLRELTAPSQKAECKALIDALPSKTLLIAMDERGKDLSSRAMAAKIQSWEMEGYDSLSFVIGGADGLTQDIKDKAHMLLGLGQKTWPHMMARLMLMEQIYRAQQINCGHPYHRD